MNIRDLFILQQNIDSKLHENYWEILKNRKIILIYN